MLRWPIWNVLVTVTVAAARAATVTVPFAGAIVVAVASPASVSSTVHDAPARMPSTVAEYPFAFESTCVASAPRAIGVMTPSTTAVQASWTVNGPAPNSATPGPTRFLSMVTDPVSNVFVIVTAAGLPDGTVTPPAGATATEVAPPVVVSVTSQCAPWMRPLTVAR